jgi:hypothetical protein
MTNEEMTNEEMENGGSRRIIVKRVRFSFKAKVGLKSPRYAATPDEPGFLGTVERHWGKNRT